MSERPTDKAIQDFGVAANKAYLAATMKDPVQLAWAVNKLADGLIDMATGIRATYILLDEVKGLLQRQQATQHGAGHGAMSAGIAGAAAAGGAAGGIPAHVMLNPGVQSVIRQAVEQGKKPRG